MALPEWLLVVSAMLAVAVLVALVSDRARVPLTVLLVIIGFVLGAVGDAIGVERPLEGEAFEQVLVFIFLPVLVFEAALGLNVRAFARNLVPIVVLAIPALLISAVVVATGVHMVLGIPLVVALLFGALISATDPVAVVAVFRSLGVPERLLTIVESESLLNDGVTIVLFEILLAIALGETISVAQGVWDFVLVFFGGAAIGAAVGMLAAFLLPWLDRLLAATLSVTVAYGAFVLAQDVLGFSGVTAGVGAGLVLAAFAPSRASSAVRELWEQLWEMLGYIANALLFLLIGLAIQPALLVEKAGAIALAVVLVLVARVAGVVPLISLLERLSNIERVGRRNEAVMIWGGLRGGVALALALAVPEEVAERETLLAMTGGVVLATLLLNATTITALVRRLGLADATRAERFLAAAARLAALQAARRRLEELHLDDLNVMEALEASARETRAQLADIHLSRDEQEQVIARRGLFVERETYERLHDEGLLPPPVARRLLLEIDDQIEEMGARTVAMHELQPRRPGPLESVALRVGAVLPEPAGFDPAGAALAEATGRRLAARRTLDELRLLERLPGIDAEAFSGARSLFERAEHEAAAASERAEAELGDRRAEVDRHAAEILARLAGHEALERLVQAGVLPASRVDVHPITKGDVKRATAPA
jgi:CPA1 family monovalent cation:H+ antiporter